MVIRWIREVINQETGRTHHKKHTRMPTSEKFSAFFTNGSTENHTDEQEVDETTHNPHTDSMFLFPIDRTEVESVIKSIKKLLKTYMGSLQPR